MSEKAVDELFDCLYRLTDLRQIFRVTSPDHELSEEQRDEVAEIVEEVKESLEVIEEEMVE